MPREQSCFIVMYFALSFLHSVSLGVFMGGREQREQWIYWKTEEEKD